MPSDPESEPGRQLQRFEINRIKCTAQPDGSPRSLGDAAKHKEKAISPAVSIERTVRPTFADFRKPTENLLNEGPECDRRAPRWIREYQGKAWHERPD